MSELHLLQQIDRLVDEYCMSLDDTARLNEDLSEALRLMQDAADIIRASNGGE